MEELRGGDWIACGAGGKARRIVGCFRAVKGCGNGSNGLIASSGMVWVRSRVAVREIGDEMGGLEEVGHNQEG